MGVYTYYALLSLRSFIVDDDLATELETYAKANVELLSRVVNVRQLDAPLSIHSVKCWERWHKVTIRTLQKTESNVENFSHALRGF